MNKEMKTAELMKTHQARHDAVASATSDIERVLAEAALEGTRAASVNEFHEVNTRVKFDLARELFDIGEADGAPADVIQERGKKYYNLHRRLYKLSSNMSGLLAAAKAADSAFARYKEQQGRAGCEDKADSGVGMGTR